MPIAREANGRFLHSGLKIEGVQTPLSVEPVAIGTHDIYKSGAYPQRMRTAKFYHYTGALPAAAYAGNLIIRSGDLSAIRVHRVQAIVLNALSAVASFVDANDAARTIGKAALHYVAGDGPTPGDFTGSSNGGPAPDFLFGGAWGPPPAGPTLLSEFYQDELVRVSGSAARVTFESPQGLLLADPVTPLAGLGNLHFTWTRVPALNDEDLAVVLIHYSAVHRGAYPPR